MCFINNYKKNVYLLKISFLIKGFVTLVYVVFYFNIEKDFTLKMNELVDSDQNSNPHN